MVYLTGLVLLCLLIFTGKGVKANYSCESHQFPCINGECITKNEWCDGDIDCIDGTDELFCAEKTRRTGHDPNRCTGVQALFMCDNGKCFPKQSRCDGYKSCSDNSDEKNCFSPVANIETPTFSNKSKVSKSLEFAKYQTDHPLKQYIDNSSSFIELNFNDYEDELKDARNWLLSEQNEDYGWGESTARAVIALYLSKSDNEKDENEMLMDKNLEIQLSIALAKENSKKLSLGELSLYINALRAACLNPKNFHDYDLVNVLRDRVDSAHQERKFVSPYVYLTLCVNNKNNHKDYQALQKIGDVRGNEVQKTDILALSVLASSCMINDASYNHPQFRRNFINKLMDSIVKDDNVCLPENIYELSLIVQALSDARVDPVVWDRDNAMKFILREQNESGSFGDILATYYTIPVLAGKSIVSSGQCNKDSFDEFTPLADLKDVNKNQIKVRYSLLYGDPFEVSQRTQLLVAEGTNFFDIMRLAQEENPNFRFKLDDTKDTPFVYSIGGIPNDPERGLYWTLHTITNRNEFRPLRIDIKKHIPVMDEETVFWLKPKHIQ